MKEGWEYKKLEEVCDVQNGFAFNSKLFGSEPIGMPLIRIRDIKRGFSETYTSESCGEEFIVSNGDCLIGMDGDFNVGIWKGGTALLNQRVCKLIPSDKVSLKFLYYYIPERLNEINSKTVFTTVKHLSSKQIKEIGVPDISLSEQQCIVSYLDSAFAKIDAVAKNAENSLNEAKALFQSALTKMMEPKEGWEEKTLKELCYKITDGTHQTPKYFDNGYIFLSSKNVTSGKIDWEHVKYIDEAQHKEMYKRVSPKVGDILLAKNGTTGVGALVDKDVVFDIYVSLALLRSKGEVIPKYLLYYINSSMAKKQFDDRIIGIGVPNLHLKEINQVLVPYPTNIKIQESMVKYLDSFKTKLDQLQANLSHTLAECEALKQAILRQTFEQDGNII